MQLRPGLRWGSLQRSPRPPSWIKGPYFLGEGRGGDGRGQERKGEGKGREGGEGECLASPGGDRRPCSDTL